jgi:hypothetical protein
MKCERSHYQMPRQIALKKENNLLMGQYALSQETHNEGGRLIWSCEVAAFLVAEPYPSHSEVRGDC